MQMADGLPWRHQAVSEVMTNVNFFAVHVIFSWFENTCLMSTLSGSLEELLYVLLDASFRLRIPGSRYRCLRPRASYSRSLPGTALARGLRRWRDTAPGRLLLGPGWGWLATVGAALRSGQRQQLLVWGSHLLLLGLLLLWLRQAGIAPWYYLSCIAYPALALAMVRSFYEHRAQPEVTSRSVLNEAAWPWRLLFLNLNYHLVHHLHPGLPWYRLRQAYLAERQHYQQLSGDFVEQGYLQLLWRHRHRPVIDPLHPFA